MLYSSIDNEKIKEIKKLQTKKYRDIDNLFLVEGEHLIKEAYEAGMLVKLVVLEGNLFNYDVDIMYVTSKVMNYLSELTTPSKVIGICRKNTCRISGNKILALDGVQDPGNMGSIIRSCVAFDVDTILVGDTCVDIYNSKVIRATQGLIFKANIVVCNLVDTLTEMKDYQILSTNVNGGTNLSDLKVKDKVIVVMGSEGSGVSSEVSKLCDSYLYIEMNKLCESLNVSVATSIILYELRCK